jgi:hypothetical protein
MRFLLPLHSTGDDTMPDSADGTGAVQFQSFLLGYGQHALAGSLARLRAGMPLALRRVPGGARVEVLTLDGEKLGWLPAEDAAALEGRPTASARVSALVPAFQRPRIMLRVAGGATEA